MLRIIKRWDFLDQKPYFKVGTYLVGRYRQNLIYKKIACTILDVMYMLHWSIGCEFCIQICKYVLTFSEAKKEKVNVLTHCNTGSLATGGYGTALGVIRALKELGHLSLAYCTETRPYNQGSRLTAYELVYEDIPAKLICDSAVSALMSTKVSTTTILVQ